MKTFQIVKMIPGHTDVIGEGVEFTRGECVICWEPQYQIDRLRPYVIETFVNYAELIGKVVEPGVVEIHPIGTDAPVEKPKPRKPKP